MKIASIENSRFSSFIYSFYSIAAGAFKNPLVAVAGVASLVNMGVQYAIAQENLNIAKSVESVGLGMANIRAGSVIRSEGS